MTDTPEQPQELSLQAHALQEMTAVEAGLQDLETKYAGTVYDVTTTAGMEAAKKARAEIREPRYAVQNIAKAKKSELAKISKAIGEAGERIIARIEKIETPIDDQIKAEEERKQAIKDAREAAERADQERQVALIAAIARLPVDLMDATVDELDAATQELLTRELPLNEVYLPDGQRTRDEAIASLQVLRARRAMADDQAKELERLREEAAAREAELAQQREQEAAERAQRDAEDRERQERDESIASAINDIRAYAHAGVTVAGIKHAIEELSNVPVNADRFGDRADAAMAAKAQAMFTLNERLADRGNLEAAQAEQAERQRQLDAQAEEQRVAAEAAARAAEEQRQADELAEAHRALEAQREAIKAASIWQAAEAALALLVREGYQDTAEVAMLTSALERGDGAA